MSMDAKDWAEHDHYHMHAEADGQVMHRHSHKHAAGDTDHDPGALQQDEISRPVPWHVHPDPANARPGARRQ